MSRYENLYEGGRPTDEDSCKIAFFGYIRGCSYRFTDNVHITGLGDYLIKEMKVIDDPCPPLTKGTLNTNQEAEEGEDDGEGGLGGEEEGNTKKKRKKRTLKQNERIIYAPHSNLGFLNYEQSSGYITIPDNHVLFTRVEEEQVDEFGNKIKVKSLELEENFIGCFK
jgi:ribosome biogenesis protein BMS1